MTRKILVVGGAGYVGAHAAKLLAANGFLPIVFDNLSTGHGEFVRWGPLVVGDIRDTASVEAAIRQHQCGAVLHFAACAYVGESVIDPAKYYDNNVAGSLSVLAAMRAANCDKLVFSSTCAVYGQPNEVPIRETTPPSPITPYGASKLMVEQIIADYRRAYGLHCNILRYFNACGADEDGDVGELRDPETHLIPRAMMALQGYISDFAIFGADFDTTDGTAVRDYIHVEDLASAHVAALGALFDGQKGDVFNLGTGRGYSVKEILHAIELETGQRLPSATGRRREGDPAFLVADASRAKAELGFVAHRSSLETIVATAWAWHLKAHPRAINPNESLEGARGLLLPARTSESSLPTS
jgi:UDP-glucose 4-epimerase/UDP-arabinose 4-epimerase